MLGSLGLGAQGIGGEPQELGTDITSAILLSGESGQTASTSNVSAQPGPNEPVNNGAPVWFAWRASIMTHPTDPLGTYTSAKLTEASMRFGVRYRPFLSSQTNFPTVMTVFKALRWPITGYGDLKQVAQATRYAYWEDQSEVQFKAIPPLLFGNYDYGQGLTAWEVLPDSLDFVPGNGWYYIRVDSALLAGGGIKRGSFVLWWDLADAGAKPTPCATCAPGTVTENGACLTVFQPNIKKQPTTDTATWPAGGGNAPPGTYNVSYCGGAWNYYSGWVVGKIPPNAPQTWTAFASGRGDAPWEAGYFFSWSYTDPTLGPQYGHFSEAFNASGTDADDWNVSTATTPAGYRSWGEAVAALGCQQIVFQHDGSAPITLHWTDEYDGNYASSGTGNSPVYSLNKVVPVLNADYACGQSIGGSTVNYTATFYFTQAVPTNYTGVTATVLIQGGVTASSTLTGQTIWADTGLNRTLGLSPNQFTLNISADPSLHKQVIATLQLSDTSGVLGIQTLTFDLAPYVVITSKQAASSFCPGFAEAEFFTFAVRGLQADNLTLQIDPAHTVTSGIVDQSCAVSPTFSFGAVGCAGNGLNFKFARTVTPTDLPLFWQDGANALPPSILTV